MSCSERPKNITSAQIALCKQCRFASGKKIWCCKFGFYFEEPSKIIQPTQNLIMPQAPRPKPTPVTMAKDFTKAMFRWGKSGFACVSEDEYIRRRSICSECTPQGWRCPHCGCMLWAKVALATEKCPAGKW